MVNVKFPDVVGLPNISPVELFIKSPEGNGELPEIDQLYGLVPPVA